MRSILSIREQLEAGSYDAVLSRLYCRPAESIAPYRRRILGLLEGYQEAFGREDPDEAAIFSAPGRTELGGNHTDHQRGKVLTGSVDLDALACAAPNGTREARIFSEGYGMLSACIDELEPVKEEENTTVSIIRGVTAGMAGMGCAIGGFDAYVISDIPRGSGLSSSACFEVLLGAVINGLFCGGKVPATEIARIGQYAENVYFGKPSGLLDQMGCAMGGIVAIDFRNREKPAYHSVKADFGGAGYALCIVDTGGDHSDLTADYAAIPREMGQAAGYFGKDVLCQVDEALFYASVPDLRKKLGDRAVLRAVHYFTDCRRVDEQVRALEQGDFDLFLSLVNASGRSSYMYLQNVSSCRDPKDQPVALALAMAEYHLRGRGACRVHGGGFAGTIQAFVPLDMVEGFRAGMDRCLGEGACRVTYIRPMGCCALIE